MKDSALPISRRQSLTRCLAVVLAVQIVAMGLGQAGGRPTFKWQSDRDITIREVLSVKVTPDTITILAKAHEPKAPALRYFGKQITLVIKRPPLDYNYEYLQKLLASPRRGTFAKELDLKQFKHHCAQLWQSTVTAAQALEKGGRASASPISNRTSKRPESTSRR